MGIQLYQGFSAYYHRTAVIILLVGFLVRLVISIWLNPGFEEAHYYLYTLHPDWSYFDRPPLVAWTTGIGVWLTGQVSQFTIRIGTLLLYTGSLIFLYLAALRLYPLQVAINTLAIASAIPIFQIAFGTLSSPDTPLLFFWAISLWLATQEFFDYRAYHPSYRLTLLCLTVGLACLGKYDGLILGLGLIGFCLFSPHYRRALRSKWLLIGIPIFLLTISPILFWNIIHDWASFRFQSGRDISTGGYQIDRVISTLLFEILYLFPTFGLPLLWAIIRTTSQQIKNFDWRQYTSGRSFRTEWDLEKRALLLWLSLPLILGFTIVSGDRQISPDWKMPGFWTATILLAELVAIGRRNSANRVPYRWFFGSIAVIILLLSIGLSHIGSGTFQTPSKSAIFGLFPIKTDTSTQIFDLQQLRQGFVSNSKLNRALKKADFVFTNRHYLGGQIGMAIEPIFHKPITCFDPEPRDFAFWSQSKQWVGKNAIYLGSKTFEVDLDAQKRYPSYFKELTKLGEIPIRRSGEIVETFSVYQAQTMLKPFPRPYGN
ncbi:glycosyltransferase family 39 protein [Chamaesiphon sp. VAR_48_metabat_135_sub]|uniref:ArnT family glycosyltransferase n=1 Tax=Chamaesiphon sp. VAR_48_metabat_135_sub TaxID=2964699 RepID=UPI00286CD2D2|nr:glycosyltransferase family 39 protein [Chamaesiphon sp. VAR_48_metabat_135_sub]